MDFKQLIVFRSYLVVGISIIMGFLSQIDKMYPDIGLSIFLNIDYQNEGLLIAYTIIGYVFYSLFLRIKNILIGFKKNEE